MEHPLNYDTDKYDDQFASKKYFLKDYNNEKARVKIILLNRASKAKK